MTVEEIIREVHLQLGEPTNWNPYDATGAIDVTTLGYQTYLRWINQGIYTIATWREVVEMRPIRFLGYRHDLFLQAPRSTFTTDVGSTESTIVIVGSATGWEGARIQWGEEERTIVQASGSSFLLNQGFSSAPGSGETVTVGFPELRLPAEERYIEVLRVRDDTNGTFLPKVSKWEDFEAGFGTPTKWKRGGRVIHLDAIPDEEIWYRVTVFALPERVTAPGDTPQLPAQFHPALVLYCLQWGYSAMQETSMKYSISQDFRALMRSLQTPEHVQGLLDDGYVLMVEGE